MSEANNEIQVEKKKLPLLVKIQNFLNATIPIFYPMIIASQFINGTRYRHISICSSKTLLKTSGACTDGLFFVFTTGLQASDVSGEGKAPP